MSGISQIKQQVIARAAGDLNTLRTRQNGCHFTDDIFKCIFLNENVWISIKISLKFVPKVPINNIPALVQRRIYSSLGLNELTHWPLEDVAVILKYTFQNHYMEHSLGTHCEIALMWMPHNLADEKSLTVQVMAWCHQAISYYLNQCWPRSMSPYGVTCPQWVNSSAPGRCSCNIK